MLFLTFLLKTSKQYGRKSKMSFYFVQIERFWNYGSLTAERNTYHRYWEEAKNPSWCGNRTPDLLSASQAPNRLSYLCLWRGAQHRGSWKISLTSSSLLLSLLLLLKKLLWEYGKYSDRFTTDHASTSCIGEAHRENSLWKSFPIFEKSL